MNELRRKIQKLLLENRIFFPYKVRLFVPAKNNCPIYSSETSENVGVLISAHVWLVNNLTQKSYCLKIKTTKIGEEWGNDLTILFKDPNDAVQYKMVWR